MSKDLERIRKYAYRHIKNFDVYIDIGALDGDTSTSLIGDFKRIICFEPNPNEFSKLSYPLQLKIPIAKDSLFIKTTRN